MEKVALKVAQTWDKKKWTSDRIRMDMDHC